MRCLDWNFVQSSGNTVIDGCNSFVVPESGAENLVVSREKTMPWHQDWPYLREGPSNTSW